MSPYMKAAGSTLTQKGPLDRTRLLIDPQVQDLAAESGSRRTLPTNIKDNSPMINTNMLRFEREYNFISSGLHKDGGPVCIQALMLRRDGGTYQLSFIPPLPDFNCLHDCMDITTLRAIPRRFAMETGLRSDKRINTLLASMLASLV